jgi:hypothetical protein
MGCEAILPIHIFDAFRPHLLRRSIMNYRGLISLLGAMLAIGGHAWFPGMSAQASFFNPPPGRGTVNEATGGASRGSFFTPKGQGTVNEATGGASRGSLFTPRSNGTVNEATGGASRGSFFTPAPNRRVLRESTGGASRNSLFTPRAGRRVVRESTGGALRTSLFRTRRNAVVKESTGGSSRVGVYHLNPNIVGAAGPAAMMALLPQNYSGMTLQERPTIFVYIPASDAKTAVFSLHDENSNVQHQATIAVPENGGVVAFTLPNNAPALAVGKNYQWFMALQVDGELTPRTPYVDGWIQRVEPTAEMKVALKGKDAMKQAELLGQNGIWYDCVAELAKARLQQPNDAVSQQEWQELLAGVELKEIAQSPILAAQ